MQLSVLNRIASIIDLFSLACGNKVNAGAATDNFTMPSLEKLLYTKAIISSTLRCFVVFSFSFNGYFLFCWFSILTFSDSVSRHFPYFYHIFFVHWRIFALYNLFHGSGEHTYLINCLINCLLIVSTIIVIAAHIPYTFEAPKEYFHK